MSAWLPNTRFVLAQDVKYRVIWALATAVHLVAFPLVVVAIIEFSAFLVRKLVSVAGRIGATRRP